MSQKIYGELLHDAERGWDAFTRQLHHRHYHDPDVRATPAPEAPVSILDTIETEIHALAAHAARIEQEVLPAAVSGVQKLEGNPVVDALLSAAHVPDEALGMVVSVIQGLEELYKPETGSPAPATPADPAMGAQPEPAPAAG